MNDTWRLAPWADLLYACDERWWAKRAPQASQFAGARVSQDTRAATRHGTALVHSHNGQGLCTRPMEINLGLNSGFQAVNLAFHLGAERMLLLGFDMGHAKGAPSHFFGDYPPETGLQVPSPYAENVKAFRPLARDLLARGVEVVNCSPGSALDCFPHGDIQTELRYA